MNLAIRIERKCWNEKKKKNIEKEKGERDNIIQYII